MFFSFFLSFLNLTYFLFSEHEALHAQWVYFLSSSVSLTPGCDMSSHRPPHPVSQSLSRRGVDPRVTYDLSLRSCISRVFVVTPHVGAVHFTGSQGGVFRPLLIFHLGLLEPAWRWYRYITSPSLRPEELTTMNFAEVYDWSLTTSTIVLGTEFSSGCSLAMR